MVQEQSINLNEEAPWGGGKFRIQVREPAGRGDHNKSTNHTAMVLPNRLHKTGLPSSSMSRFQLSVRDDSIIQKYRHPWHGLELQKNRENLIDVNNERVRVRV